MSQLKLDLWQIANTKSRRKNARGGMEYLLARVRRELEERWWAVHGGGGFGGDGVNDGGSDGGVGGGDGDTGGGDAGGSYGDTGGDDNTDGSDDNTGDGDDNTGGGDGNTGGDDDNTDGSCDNTGDGDDNTGGGDGNTGGSYGNTGGGDGDTGGDGADDVNANAIRKDGVNVDGGGDVQTTADAKTIPPSPSPPTPPPPQKVLLIDFAGGDFDLGAHVNLHRISPLEDARAELSFGGGDFDGIIMCMQPAWLEWPELLTQTLRALREGGVLLFCTFGPDTLMQLRDAWRQTDSLPHVHPFIDMHLIGDQLLRSGFSRPIVDADRVTVEYHDADEVHADLRREGFVNILRERRKTLTGAARAARYRRALHDLRAKNNMLAVTYELIYGAATAPSSSASLRVAPPKLRNA